MGLLPVGVDQGAFDVDILKITLIKFNNLTQFN